MLFLNSCIFLRYRCCTFSTTQVKADSALSRMSSAAEFSHPGCRPPPALGNHFQQRVCLSCKTRKDIINLIFLLMMLRKPFAFLFVVYLQCVSLIPCICASLYNGAISGSAFCRKFLKFRRFLCEQSYLPLLSKYLYGNL